MKSIKFLAVLFAAVLMTIPTFAQRGDKAHKGKRGPGMMQALDLTAEQEAKAKVIGETYRPKFEAIRSQETDREVAREKMKQLRDEQEAEFKKILTADQITKLDAHKAERKAQRKAFKEKVKNVDKEGMKDEMKTYKDQNIKPVLLEQRKKLEAQISVADQAEIKELRVAMKAAKKEIKAVKSKYENTRSDVASGKRKGSGARSKIKAIKDNYAGKYEAAQALAKKYDAQITTLYNEIESKRAQWESDISDIKEDYFAEVIEEFGDDPRAEKWRNKKEAKADRRSNKDKVAFLLMDVNKKEKKVERRK